MARIFHCIAVSSLLLAAGASTHAQAQNFPERNITILHAYSPGSSWHVVADAPMDMFPYLHHALYERRQ